MNRFLDKDWSLAEVIRRAGELFAMRFPNDRNNTQAWQLPKARHMGPVKVAPSEIRALCNDRYSALVKR